MAWGTYILRSSVVSVFIRLRVMARENPFRFEMMHRTPGNPTTVNREHQHGAKQEKKTDERQYIANENCRKQEYQYQRTRTHGI